MTFGSVRSVKQINGDVAFMGDPAWAMILKSDEIRVSIPHAIRSEKGISG